MRMDGQATAQRRRRSLGADDWIDAAMAVLAEDGVAAVAVEPLAARLGATKGSFYHHFPNRDALIAAALERWERRDTTDVRERLRLIADPRARIHAVMTAAITGREGGLRDAALLASAPTRSSRPSSRRASARADPLPHRHLRWSSACPATAPAAARCSRAPPTWA